MKIEREILGIDVTIYFDDYGNVEEFTAGNDWEENFIIQNYSEFESQAEELVRNHFDGLREEAEDRQYEFKRGY